MDLSGISAILAFLGNIPAVGPVIATILSYALPVSAVATAIIACWHGLVGLVVALSMVPGLHGMKPLADKLKLAATPVDSFINTWIVGLLKQLSLLPAPQQKSPPQA